MNLNTFFLQDEDVKLLKQAGADDKPGGDVIAATGHTACKSRSASVASALIVVCGVRISLLRYAVEWGDGEECMENRDSVAGCMHEIFVF